MTPHNPCKEFCNEKEKTDGPVESRKVGYRGAQRTVLMRETTVYVLKGMVLKKEN